MQACCAAAARSPLSTRSYKEPGSNPSLILTIRLLSTLQQLLLYICLKVNMIVPSATQGDEGPEGAWPLVYLSKRPPSLQETQTLSMPRGRCCAEACKRLFLKLVNSLSRLRSQKALRSVAVARKAACRATMPGSP
jgi:hypothetical protein